MTKLVFNAETLAKSINSENGNEIVFEEYFNIQKSEGENPKDPKFEYFKKKILDHLAELEKKENHSIAKAIDIDEWIQKANFPVGTVRTWNGQKFKKITPKKWARVYETESRGAKLAVAALRRKAATCRNSEELLQLCLENMERFRDNNGRPLPFVKELSDYISGRNDKIESTKAEKKAKDEKIKKFFDEKAKKYGVNVEVNNGLVSISKDGKKFSHAFRYEEGKKDGHGEDWNDGAFGNLIIYARQEGLKTPKKEEPKENEPVKADSVKNALNNEEKVKFVNKLSGEVYHDYETDPSKFAVYAKDGKSKGLAMTQDIADIINSHSEVSVYDWANAIAEDVNKKYPNIRKEYVRYSLSAIRMGYRNGDKEKVMILPDSKEEPKKTEPKQDNELPKTDNEPNKKGIESIREKYQSSLSVEGDEDEIYVGKEAIQGKWKLVEADAPSASHDEITFHKTEGFPTAKDGSTVNDRDYEHDTEAQETVIDIASDFDGRALGFDSPIVVTQDGVVTSGNNRTMSSKIAARKGTDTKYIEALKKRAKKFGFSADDVAKFKHPRVVFETDHTGDYTTSEFAKYNESGKKAMNPVEKAVKVSKMIQPQTIEDVASIIGEFDTMGDLYADKKASQSIFNTLIQSNIIQKTDLPQYYSDNTVTASGKEFLETVLIGSVINETNIRSLNTKGGRSIRQKLVRAITPLIENKGMKGYSINKELNEAVGIAVEVAHHKDQFPNVEAFSKHQDMFRKLDPVSIELAKKLEGTQKGFAEFMLDMNVGLRPAANGEVDIFLGECESKEDIVNRVLNIKKTVEKALNRFFRIFGATM